MLVFDEDLYELKTVVDSKNFRLSIVFASPVNCTTTFTRQEWVLQEHVSGLKQITKHTTLRGNPTIENLGTSLSKTTKKEVPRCLQSF